MPAEPPRGMRVALVTGAGGFVGAHLSRELVRRGAAVRALVRDASRARRLAGSGATLVRGDLTAPASLEAALAGVDTVFHCAALVTGDPRPTEQFEAVNVKGARELFAACGRVASVERVVHVSTVAVYGHTRRGTVTDESHPRNPDSLYGITKLAAEEAAREAHAAGLPIVIARPMWVYGADAPAAAKLFDLVRRGRMVTIGGAANAIQPIAVEDLVAGLIACATAPGVEGEAFHFAGPRAITTREFCASIARSLGVAPPRLDIPLPIARCLAWGCERFYPRALGKPPFNREKLGIFVNENAYSIAKAERRLGWRPRIAFEEGAERVVRQMRDDGAAP